MSNETLLIEAIKSGDTKVVEKLLLEEAALAKMLVNVEMFEPQTDNSTRAYAQPMSLLMLALISEHAHAVDIISLLLAAGADINTQVEVIVPDFGATALAVAIMCGQLEAAKLLIERGAKVNVADPKTGDTPLHHLAQLPHECYMSSLAFIEFDLVPTMIEHGAISNARNHARQTPIEIATAQGKFLLMDLLTLTPPQPGLGITNIPPVYITPVQASFFPTCGHTQQPLGTHSALLTPQST